MKRLVGIFLVIFIAASACAPKPMYKTKAGKAKLKHYNALQFNDRRSK